MKNTETIYKVVSMALQRISIIQRAARAAYRCRVPLPGARRPSIDPHYYIGIWSDDTSRWFLKMDFVRRNNTKRWKHFKLPQPYFQAEMSPNSMCLGLMYNACCLYRIVPRLYFNSKTTRASWYHQNHLISHLHDRFSIKRSIFHNTVLYQLIRFNQDFICILITTRYM